MEAIFSVPYPEYAVINEIAQVFRKKDGYSTYIPTSRQQQGVDFLLHVAENNKCVRFQVKSSKAYLGRIGKDGKIRDYKYHLWFNNFINKYQKGVADYYVLFGIYSLYDIERKVDAKNNHWENIILCVPDPEMETILGNILTKKENKPDRFFGVGFNTPDRVFGTRGFAKLQELSEYRLVNKIEAIKKYIQS